MNLQRAPAFPMQNAGDLRSPAENPKQEPRVIAVFEHPELVEPLAKLITQLTAFP